MRQLLLLLIFGSTAATAVASDPVPIRREIASDERAALILEKQQSGPVVRMTRDQFEERVRRAEAARTQPPPQLVEAIYRARLHGETLRGDASWTIRSNADGQRLLPIERWSPALTAAKWSDGRSAIIGKLETESDRLGLLVERAGEQQLQIEWSLHTKREQEGLRIKFDVPACAIRRLVLDLPNDCEPIVPSEQGLVSRLGRVPDSLRQVWDLQFGGQNDLSFVIKSTSSHPSTQSSSQLNRVELRGRTAEIDCQIDLDFGRSLQNQVELIIPHELVPTQVAGAAVERWEVTRGNDEAEQRLRVTLSRPVESTQVHFRGVMLLTLPQPWSCPAVTVANSISRGERWTIQIAPELAWEGVQSNSMRLADARHAANGEQIIELVTDWAQRDETRPTGRIRYAAADWQASTRLSWRIENERQFVDAELSITPLRNSLSHFEFSVPANYQVDAVQPADGSEIRWSLTQGTNNRKVLSLDFEKSLAVGTTQRVIVNLRARVNNSRLPFPNLTPMKGLHVESYLQTWIAPIWTTELNPGPAVAICPPIFGPWPDQSPTDTLYSLGGALDGTLILHRLRSPMNVAGYGGITMSDNGPHWDYRLQIEPINGPIDSVFLRCSVPAIGPWDWHCESDGARVKSVICLDDVFRWSAVSDLTSAFTACAADEWNQSGSWWLVTFDRTVSGPLTLSIAGDVRIAAVCRAVAAMGAYSSILAPLPKGPTSEIPCWSVVGSMSQRHEWNVAGELTGPGFAMAGMEEIATSSGRTYRQKDQLGRISMPDSVAVIPTTLGTTRLNVTVTEDGRLDCLFVAKITRVGATNLRVTMPAEAEWHGTSIDDAAVASRIVQTSEFEIRIPGNSVGCSLRIKYMLPQATDSPVMRLIATPPQLNCLSSPADITWSVPESLQPLFSDTLSEASLPGESRPKWAPSSNSLVANKSNSLWVARPPAICVIAVMSAVAALILLVKFHSRRRALIAAAIGGFAWIWLPTTLQPIAWVWGAIWLASVIGVFGSRWIAHVSSVAVVLLAFPGNGAAPQPSTVIILPTQGSLPEMAVVPFELIGRLDAMSHLGKPTVSAVILLAEYRASCDSPFAQIDAKWEVFAFQDMASLQFSNGGLRIQDVTIDGVAAYPVVTDNQCRLEIVKSGRTTVAARFVVPVQSESARKIARFEVPPAAIAQMQISAVNDTRMSQLTAQRCVVEIAKERAVIDLGYTSKVEVGWQTEDRPESTIPSSIRDGYYWELQSPVAVLHATIRCMSKSNGWCQFQWKMPDELNVDRIRSSVPDQVIEWQVVESPTGRYAKVRMLAEAAGEMVVHADFTPIQRLSLADPLPYPSVTDATETLLGWRGEMGLTPGRVQGVVPFSGATFAAEFENSSIASTQPSMLYRKLSSNAAIRVNKPQEVTWRGNQVMRWKFGPRRLYLETSIELRAEPAARPLIECEVPESVVVTAVEGAGVASWSRTGTRLQAWFDRPRSSATLTWTGYVNRQNPNAKIDIPFIKLVGGGAGALLELSGRPGVFLEPIQLQNLTIEPSSIPGSQLRYRCDKPYYRVSLQPKLEIANTDFSVNTKVDRVMGNAVMVTNIVAENPSGELACYGIQICEKCGDQIQLDGSGARVVEERAPQVGTRNWSVYPTVNAPHHLKVSVSTRALIDGPWTLPRVSLRFGDSAPAKLDRTVEIGQNLLSGPTSGLRQLEARKWQMVEDDCQLMVESVDRNASPVRVPLLESVITQSQQQEWCIDNKVWLSHDLDTDLTLRWKQPFRIEDISVDGNMLTTGSGAMDHVIVPLVGSPRGRCVSWRIRVDSSPSLNGLVLLPELWVAGHSVVPVRMMWSQEIQGHELVANGLKRLSFSEAEQIRSESIAETKGMKTPNQRDSEIFHRRAVATWEITSSTYIPQIGSAWFPAFWRIVASIILLFSTSVLLRIST